MDPAATIAEAARRAGLALELPCGGKGTCGRCRVTIVSGDVVRYSPPPEGAAPEEALACKTAVGPSDCVIEAVEHDLAAEDRGGDFSEMEIPYKSAGPLVEEHRIKVPGPRPDDGLSDFDRTNRELGRNFGTDRIKWDLSAMRSLPEELRIDDGILAVYACKGDEGISIAGARSWKSRAKNLGVAVDLGTTTVSARIVDPGEGLALSEMTGYNDQIHCGEDIISRIHYAARPGGLAELRQRALDTVNRLIAGALERCGAAAEDLHCAVVSANTVMTHLILGLLPEYLRLAPYTPALLSVPEMRASDVGLALNSSGIVRFSPSVGSYVGGDITTGLLCTDMATAEDIALFIDVGTNGEIVLGNRDYLLTCACSAGPAFEGAGIGCGMRAMEGAVNSVSVDKSSGLPTPEVIGGGKARGICGSGMIDLIGELFLSGWLDRSGRFERIRQSPAIELEGRRARYRLAEGEKTLIDGPLFITEQDIDNVMRAKAAVYSACDLLLGHAGIGFADLSRVYIAGGFGKHLSIANAITIGLFPDIPEERFSYLGNSSLEGATRLLLSKEAREILIETAGRMTYINLSDEAGYAERYSAALFLPHTDLESFPSVAGRIRKAK